MKLNLEEISTAVGGVVISGDTDKSKKIITSVSTDSRNIQPGGLFIALRGDNFDGHDHAAEAAEKGAVCVISEKELPLPTCVKVSSTYTALLDLASYYRDLHSVKIAAVTGSVGKTTTKDMIASVLAQKYVTLKTPGNRNNLIGLPCTLLSLNETNEAAVLEMGMNHFGEIHKLSVAAKPDVAVITNIGDSHVEFLGSREGILKAKLEIMDGIKPGGTLILNGNDPLLKGLRGNYLNTILCTVDEGGDVWASEIEPFDGGTKICLHIKGDSREIKIPSPGAHMVMNALLAAAAGYSLGLALNQIAEGIGAFIPTGRRMETHLAHGMTVIDDAYNASPDSMRAAINVLADMKDAKRRVCVLGDMLELGGHAERLHRELGEYIAESGIDLVIAVGENARYFAGNNSLIFKNNEEFLLKWRTVLNPGDAVLVKASQGMRFNEIIQGVLA